MSVPGSVTARKKGLTSAVIVNRLRRVRRRLDPIRKPWHDEDDWP
jgi:hypothetical protein